MDDVQAHHEADGNYTQIFRGLHDSEEQAILKNKALNSLLNKFKLKTTSKTFDRDPSDLCCSCRTIDFGAVFSGRAIWASLHDETNVLDLFPGSAVPVHILPTLDSTMLDTTCPLCKVLATMVYGPDAERHFERYGPSVWHLRAVACPPSGQIALFLTDHWENFTFSRSYWERSMEEGWLLPHRLNSTRSTSLYEHYRTSGVPLAENVDYSCVKRSLTDCETHHGQYCSGTLPGYPINARVIDCTKRTVVLLTSDMKYVALSYVWGSEKLQSFTADQRQNDGIVQWSLPEHLPQSIEDSMEVIKCLGLRYLWVDRYCIQQVHATDKKLQISQMAKIYGRAYVTICALGPHDDYGLYGVSKPRARNYFTGADGRTTIVKAHRPERIRSYINGSYWSKRGWTYQEALLSRRCLFFTREGFFMVCREWCTSEGVILPPGDSLTREVRIAPHRLFSHLYSSEMDFAFQALVDEYQKRTLKYDSDRLCALEGLLSTQELSTIIGVPIMKIPQPKPDTTLLIRIGFVHGLAWRCSYDSDGDGDMCSQFPSWSWLSRKMSAIEFQYFGKIRPSWRNVPSGPILHIPYFADVSIQTAKETLKTTEEFLTPFIKSKQDKAINEDLRYLHIKTSVARWCHRENPDIKGRICNIKVQFDISPSEQLPYWLEYEDYSPGDESGDISENSSLETKKEILGTLSYDDPKALHRIEGGIAILMFAITLERDVPCDTSPIDDTRPRNREDAEVNIVWLAIHETGDGTYRRDGIIRTDGHMRSPALDRANRRCIEAPPNLETIKLG
jgi:hypothetical protein